MNYIKTRITAKDYRSTILYSEITATVRKYTLNILNENTVNNAVASLMELLQNKKCQREIRDFEINNYFTKLVVCVQIDARCEFLQYTINFIQ